MRLGTGLGLTKQQSGIGGYGHIDVAYNQYTLSANPANITYLSHFDLSSNSYTFTGYPATITAASANPIGYNAHSSTSGFQVGSPGSIDITDLTVASNSNRLLVAAVGFRIYSWVPETYVTGVTWAGNPLTQRVLTEAEDTVNSRINRIYYFDLTGSAITTGNNTLTVSWAGSTQNVIQVIVHVGSYYNVTPGAGYDYQQVNSGETDVSFIEDTITPSGADDLIVVNTYAVDNDPEGTWTHETELTEIDYIHSPSGLFSTVYSHDLSSGASPFTYQEDFSKTRKLGTVSASYPNI